MLNEETPTPMLAQANCIRSLEELRSLVYETLCSYDQLQPGAFTMTERILVRGNLPCGIHFCLHGPRSVKYTSIWETDRNTLLFYNPTGERFHRTQLTEAPQLTATG